MVTTLGVLKVFLIGAMTLMCVGYESVRAAEVLDSGKFVTVDADHETTGTVEILQKENRIYVRLGDDFSTAEGPDLHLLLHNRIPQLDMTRVILYRWVG
jgi:hypothetical protein